MSEGEMMNTITLLTTPEAAKVLRLQPGSLRVMRLRGTGPRFVRIGSKVAYEAQARQDYIASRTFQNTCEAQAALAKKGA